MKIVTLSDTHGLHENMRHKMPDGDVLIHVGDFMNSGLNFSEFESFAKWFSSFPHETKIICYGNHDRMFEMMPNLPYIDAIKKRYGIFPYCAKDKPILMPNVGPFYIEKHKFHHMPYTLAFREWAFMKQPGPEMQAVCDDIDDDVKVILTHGPVWGFQDRIKHGSEHLGSKELLTVVARVTPKYVVHGHIHGGYGVRKFNKYTTLVNCSMCDEDYKPVNKPIVIDL